MPIRLKGVEKIEIVIEETKQKCLSVATGFLLIIFERFDGLADLRTQFLNFHWGNFKLSTIKTRVFHELSCLHKDRQTETMIL
jgi:hypothetical protein